MFSLPAMKSRQLHGFYLAFAVLVFFGAAFLAGLFLVVLAVMLPFPLLHAILTLLIFTGNLMLPHKQSIKKFFD